jgi:hypothetical protein
LWSECRLTLIGHALLEKLLAPRKAMTAHVWPLHGEVDAALPEDLLRSHRGWLPLPVLGVPDWWNPNEQIGFYDDAAVFRAAPGHLENQPPGVTTASH